MSLLSAVIVWLLRGLPGRPAPALVRSSAGRQFGPALRSDCLWWASASPDALADPALIWRWRDRRRGRNAPGTGRCRTLLGAVDQWRRL